MFIKFKLQENNHKSHVWKQRDRVSTFAQQSYQKTTFLFQIGKIPLLFSSFGYNNSLYLLIWEYQISILDFHWMIVKEPNKGCICIHNRLQHSNNFLHTRTDTHHGIWVCFLTCHGQLDLWNLNWDIFKLDGGYNRGLILLFHLEINVQELLS